MTTPISNILDTWNDAGTDFFGIKLTITDTLYDTGSKMLDISSSVAGGYIRVDVNGNLDISGSYQNPSFEGYVDFESIAAPAWAEGRVFYDSTEKALSYYNEDNEITVNIGRELVARVANTSGSDILDGSVVYIDHASTGLPEVLKSLASPTEAKALGIATTDIADSGTGYVTTFGVVRGIDTSSWSVGDILYLSSSVAGELVNTIPAYPNQVVEIAHVLTAAVDGAIFVHIAHQDTPVPIIKSYTFASRSSTSGSYYQAGYYSAPAADANLTNAAPTQVYGTANIAKAAHAFIVSAGDGATDGSDLVLTVTGTSIDDAGTRTPADSEVVVADCLVGACPVDTYLETSKKWIGQITYTLTSTGGAAFAFSFNYGWCKYEDFNNQNVTLRGLECVGLCNAADAGFNLQLYHHNDIGWVYSAAAFVPGNTPILDMNVTHSTEKDIAAGEHFAYKYTGLSDAVAGADSEGLVLKVTTTTNNAVSYMDSHLTVTAP